MGLSRRRFTREFKLAAIERLESGASVARALEVSPSLVLRWRQEFRESAAAGFPGGGKRRVIGWALDQRKPEPGPVHHPDRFLDQPGLRGSMIMGL